MNIPQRDEQRRRMINVVVAIGALCVTVFVFVILFWVAAGMIASRAALGQDNCRGFISTGCCCTSGCCFEITDADVRQISETHYVVPASGKTVARSWSKDGRAYLCACNSVNGKWQPDIMASPRCLYMPMQGS